MQEVGYYLYASEEETGFVLIKRVDNTPDNDITEGGSSFELIDSIASLTFEFKGENNESEWEETWNSFEKKALPGAVRIEISFADEGEISWIFSTQFPIYQGKSI